jgi:hypothetical protein
MKITILQRPGQFTAKDFTLNLQNALQALRGDLKASIKIDGFSRGGWATISVDGGDAEILTELIARSQGRARTLLGNVELGRVYEGIIDGVEGSIVGVDIGIETPGRVTVRIRPEVLRAQLADGKILRVEEITRDYCLLSGIRTAVRITRLDPDSRVVEGWFADIEINRLSYWVGSHLDRILVTDCFRHEVESAIRRAKLDRDIVAVESVTLTAHSVVCKLGTDAVGLIPKLGSILRKRELTPFVPKRILARCRPW